MPAQTGGKSTPPSECCTQRQLAASFVKLPRLFLGTRMRPNAFNTGGFSPAENSFWKRAFIKSPPIFPEKKNYPTPSVPRAGVHAKIVQPCESVNLVKSLSNQMPTPACLTPSAWVSNCPNSGLARRACDGPVTFTFFQGCLLLFGGADQARPTHGAASLEMARNGARSELTSFPYSAGQGAPGTDLTGSMA